MRACSVLVAALLVVAVPAVARAAISLEGPWRHQVGDDPGWRDPGLDDTSWPTVELPEAASGDLRVGGIVWFRKRITVPKGIVDPAIVFGAGIATGYEVFADGEPIGAHGAPGREAPGQPVVFALPREALDDGEVVIAIRHWQLDYVLRFGPGSRWLRGPFVLGERSRVQLEADRALAEARIPLVTHLWAGVALIALGLFHLSIWRRRRELVAYFWYGISTAAVGLSHVLYLRGEPVWPYYPFWLDAIVGPFVALVVVVAGIEFILAFFDYPRPRRALMAAWSLLALHQVLDAIPATRPMVTRLGLPLMEVMTAVAALLVGWRLIRGDRRARVVAAGLGILIVMIGGLMLGQRTGALSVYWSITELGMRPDFLGTLCFHGTMAYALADQFTGTLDRLDGAYAAAKRFVPQDFLALLGRSEITEVVRGDASEQEMTVMFADVRGFSTRSEKHNPKENFAWLNRYLEIVEPPIRGAGGFVNQYYGDGILALFPSAEGAVTAARGMLAAVASAADELGDDGPLQIGIGLHTGSLMLGTIGGRERLDTGVVGDAVNTAARIESLTKTYQCALLLSEATLAALDDPESGRWEEVDRVAPKGKSQQVRLYTLARDA